MNDTIKLVFVDGFGSAYGFIYNFDTVFDAYMYALTYGIEEFCFGDWLKDVFRIDIVVNNKTIGRVRANNVRRFNR